MIDLTEDKVEELVKRSGIQIQKRDIELGKSEAMGGATLEGIVMTIRNVSNHDVVVRADIGSDYIEEGKTQLVICLGCTGGRHRSVTLAEELYSRLSGSNEYGLRVEHRDIPKDQER